MKPRIFLRQSWSDNGWRYEQWCCEGNWKFAFGATPIAAFMAWSAKP